MATERGTFGRKVVSSDRWKIFLERLVTEQKERESFEGLEILRGRRRDGGNRERLLERKRRGRVLTEGLFF